MMLLGMYLALVACKTPGNSSFPKTLTCVIVCVHTQCVVCLQISDSLLVSSMPHSAAAYTDYASGRIVAACCQSLVALNVCTQYALPPCSLSLSLTILDERLDDACCSIQDDTCS